MSTYLFAEVHAEAGEGHDVAMMNGSPGVDTLGASDTEVQLSGVNVFQKNFGNYAKYFDEVITSAGDGEDTAVLLDGQAEAVDPSAATIGALADVAQALWLNEFEKIKLQNSGSSDESEINGVDEVFAYWQ
ncbi:MAG: hypothetical protein GXY83_08305 [Rhodopirellula sp.]|nr:hypothetical protein [Rhodopirellula sp.]